MEDDIIYSRRSFHALCNFNMVGKLAKMKTTLNTTHLYCIQAMSLPAGVGVGVGESCQGGGVGGACHAHTAADRLATIVRLLAGRVAPPPPSETNK